MSAQQNRCWTNKTADNASKWGRKEEEQNNLLFPSIPSNSVEHHWQKLTQFESCGKVPICWCTHRVTDQQGSFSITKINFVATKLFPIFCCTTCSQFAVAKVTSWGIWLYQHQTTFAVWSVLWKCFEKDIQVNIFHQLYMTERWAYIFKPIVLID